MTKEDVENASVEGEQECWFGEGGCLELSEMESGHGRDCCLIAGLIDWCKLVIIIPTFQ